MNEDAACPVNLEAQHMTCNTLPVGFPACCSRAMMPSSRAACSGMGVCLASAKLPFPWPSLQGYPLLLACDAIQPGCVQWRGVFTPPFSARVRVPFKIACTENANQVLGRKVNITVCFC